GVARIDAERRVSDAAERVNDSAIPGNGGVDCRGQVGVDKTERAVGHKANRAAVDAAAPDEVIAVVEQLAGVRRLQGPADRRRAGRGSVDRAVRRRTAAVAAA